MGKGRCADGEDDNDCGGIVSPEGEAYILSAAEAAPLSEGEALLG